MCAELHSHHLDCEHTVLLCPALSCSVLSEMLGVTQCTLSSVLLLFFLFFWRQRDDSCCCWQRLHWRSSSSALGLFVDAMPHHVTTATAADSNRQQQFTIHITHSFPVFHNQEEEATLTVSSMSLHTDHCMPALRVLLFTILLCFLLLLLIANDLL